MIGKLLKMQLLEDDVELAYSSQDKDDEEKREIDGRPAWMRTLHVSLATWMKMVPTVSSSASVSNLAIN